MRRVKVSAGGRHVPVTVGSGTLGVLERILAKEKRPSQVHVVTDRTVEKLHGGRLSRVLEACKVRASRSVLPAGEGSKSAARLEVLWRAMVRAGLDRESCVIAHGGGVVGDLAGFAAATIFRGIDFVQVPTTLLAMVDASVGGKTGINLPEGKNLVGAFHQPLAVVADLEHLETLPRRQFRAGMAEVVKTAAIASRRLFTFLEREADAVLAGDTAARERIVAECVRLKAAVVSQDEREAGLRRILNFGHTLGHAIEAARGYRGILHGEAVAVGMTFAARLGERCGVTPPGTAERLEQLLRRYGLPVRLSGLDPSRILPAMGRDKKRGPKGLRWVFLDGVGSAVVVEDVPASLLEEELVRFSKGVAA